MKTVAFGDPLTGVKSKHAYVELEQQLDAAILNGEAAPFAIVVCDVNGLKFINDTKGHKAGDRYLCDAAKVICNIFKHSPVFRIGGDEFVAVLRDHDYEHRDELFTGLRMSSEGVQLGEGVIIACGMAGFDPAGDIAVASAFERADTMMYENKKMLKGARL